MPLVRFNWSPETRILRQFGWITCAAGLAVGGFVWSGWTAAAAVIVGLLSGVASLVRPALNRPLYVLLSAITYPIGVVLSVVVLAVLFYMIVTPIGILVRMFGHDPLDRGQRPRSTTYWVDARPPRPKEDYFRQY
jgi:hypothetical protein